MSEKIVCFSRLLRIFELNDNPAYIIELEENNNKKNLYISYMDKDYSYKFELYHKTKLKKEFKDLSAHCLMSKCDDASYMFYGSPITHFKADCSFLVCGHAMFYSSSLCFLNTEFPLLENADLMFYGTKIKEIMINFPNLIDGVSMFCNSHLKKITSQFPLLEDGEAMFKNTLLKEINCHFQKMEYKREMFSETPPELKQNYPYYFV